MRLCGRSPGRGLGRVLALLVGVSGLADGLWLQRRCPLAVWNGSLPSALAVLCCDASGGLSRASSPPVPLAGTRHMRLSYVRPCTCRRGSAPGPSLPKVSSARRSALWAASRHRGPLPCPWPFCPPFASLRIPSHPIPSLFTPSGIAPGLDFWMSARGWHLAQPFTRPLLRAV